MKYIFLVSLALLVSAVCGLASCAGNNPSTTAGKTTTTNADVEQRAVPHFVGDSAHAYIDTQCAFGARVPGTPPHSKCAAWLINRLQHYCDTIAVQRGEVTAFDGARLPMCNIVGIVNPTAEQRILLLAHWDCRPWADNDPDENRRSEPVSGANDGASGVAVLLELARCMAEQRPAVGVDLLLTDVEDWGTNNDADSWALGTQYWARTPHVAGYRAMYGILLDMVGARDAVFAPEYYSMRYADGVVRMVWKIAREAGYGAYFTDRRGTAVTDDHVVVNEQAGIPCIDIIDQRPDGFFSGWHTTGDTPDVIDSATLQAVGQTLLQLIYSY